MKYFWVIWSSFFLGWDSIAAINAFVEGKMGMGWLHLAFAIVFALLTWLNVRSARKLEKLDKELAHLDGQLATWAEVRRINDEFHAQQVAERVEKAVQDAPQYGDRI